MMTLAYLNWDEPFHLKVDASQFAIGAVLAQRDNHGKMRPIAFSLSTLNHGQQNYSTGEKEVWAVVADTRKWHKYLQTAKQVVIWSDHIRSNGCANRETREASLRDGFWNSNPSVLSSDTEEARITSLLTD